MDVEAILERVGGWGRYQKLIYFFACLPAILGAAVTMGFSWTAYIMEHRCLVSGCEDANNATYTADFLHSSTPTDADHTWSRCSVFKQINLTDCQESAFNRSTEEACSQWVYDTSVMESTLVSEFGLVCDDEFLQPLGNSMYFAGVAVGSVLIGIAADRMGRLLTLMGCIAATVVIQIATAFIPNYTTFIVFRFFSAIFSFGLFSVPFVLSMELSSMEARSFCGIMINAFYAIGEALVGVFPIFVKDWRALQLIYSAPILLFGSYWFFLPESPRWLVTAGKTDKAEQFLRNVAKWNRTSFPEEMVQQTTKNEKSVGNAASSGTLLDIIKYPVLLKRAIVLGSQWLVVSMVYYGISMLSTDLGGDVYVNFILTMLIEIPSYVFCTLTVNPLGRKLLVGASFLLCGVCTIGAGLVAPSDLTWLTTTLSLAGKFGASSAFSLMYLYTAELYPTALRSQGVGLASCVGRIGSIVGPFIADLGQGCPTLPMCIFGTCGLVAGVITAFLPETSGHDLPTTVAEAIDFGRDQPLLPIPCLIQRHSHTRLERSGHHGPTSEDQPEVEAGLPTGLAAQPVEGALPTGLVAQPVQGALPTGLAAQPAEGALPTGLAAQPVEGALPTGLVAQPVEGRLHPQPAA